MSVIIPTYQRTAKLSAALACLARQDVVGERFEVLVGVDGPDEATHAAAPAAWRAAGGDPSRLRVVACARAGLNATRNALLPLATGRIMLSLNDDVLPAAGLVRAHLEAQAAGDARAADRVTIVAGHSPFVQFEQPTLFDDLCAHTSMLFFYDRMIGPTADSAASDPDHDWGFRHCYGLNMSMPLSAVRESGGFIAFDKLYGYDDIELAWRLKRRFGARLVFRPAARADHDHRYTPGEVLAREYKLGVSAWHFASREPEFCREVFGRDIRSADELAYSRAFVVRERATAQRLERAFLTLDQISAPSISGQHEMELRELVYQQHLLLKRWHWRRGLVDSATADSGYSG